MLLVLLGCPQPIPLGPPSPATWQGGFEPVAVDLAGDPSSSTLWVRGINEFGASSEGSAVRVELDGASTSVDLDAFGYGVVPIEPGLHTAVADGRELKVAGYSASWNGLGGLKVGAPAPALAIGDAMVAGRGVLLREGNTLWWASPDGADHVVLVADGPIRFVRTGLFDGDDTLDAAVATDNAVYVLRGRPDGGMSWIGSLKAPNHRLTSFEAGDANDDGIIDLVVIWAGQLEGDLLDVWAGDGFFGFEAGPARRLARTAVAVTVADAQGDGQEVTITHDGLAFDQFYANGPVFEPTGPLLSIELVDQVEARSPGDLDGDDLDELAFLSPYSDEEDRGLVLIELGANPNISTLDREAPAHVAFADFTQDGHPDVLFAEDRGSIFAIRSDGDSLNTINLGPSVGGPVAYRDHRLLLAEPDRWMWAWVDTDDERFLRFRNEPLVSPGVSPLDGQFVLASLDSDDIPELVGLRSNGLDAQLRIWSVGQDQVVDRGRIQLDLTLQSVHGIALCGTDVWVLLASQLFGVNVTDPDDLQLFATTDVVGKALACRPDGVAVLTDSEAIEYNRELRVINSVPAASAEGLSFDALGLLFCEQSDCGVLRVLSGGEQVVFVGSPIEASADGVPLLARGVPSVADVDLDGLPDVVFNLDGAITVYRNTPDGFGAAEFYRTEQRFIGPLSFADHDGDGNLDAWGVEPENLRLRVTNTQRLPTVISDTSDTSDTGTMGAQTGDTGAQPTGQTSDTGGGGHTGSTADTAAP